MERGLRQRVTALNRFIHDVYHEPGDPQGRHRPGRAGRSATPSSAPRCRASTCRGDIYSHIAGIDIVRAADADGSGSYYVLEDNLRVPSGVSYMLENRKMMMRLFPELFSQHRVAPVAHYPDLLLETLRVGRAGGGRRSDRRRAHARHVQQRLLRARVPRAADGRRAGRGPGPVRQATTSSTCARRRARKRVDVIYRRVDDDFLDPLAFRADSTLGCAGPARRLPRRQRDALRTRSAPASPTTSRSTRSCRR